MREKNPETYEEKLSYLRELREQAIHSASEAAVEKQHAKGKMTARERIEKLLDPGTFEELDTFVRHRTYDFEMQKNRPWGDAVVTGYGEIDGRTVFVFSQDFTVFGGSLGEVMAEKMVKVMDMAAKVGAPVIGINDSGGARIQEGVVSLGAYGDVFVRNVQCSGVIPQISVIMGPCAGGAVYSPAMTDFIFMVKETSHMFITGPDVIKTVTGEEVEFEELGGAMTHNTKSGVAHFASEDEESCLEDVRYLFGFLPSNNLEMPPRAEPYDDPERTEAELDGIVPADPQKPYDMRDVVSLVVDDGDFFEVHEHFAKNIICGFSPPRRLPGRDRRQPAEAPRRRARHRVLGEGGALRPHLRRLQRPAGHLHRRPRLHARHLPGVERDHPPRREAALRVHRGDRAEADRRHPQGLRRRLRRHELQAHARRLQLRLADRGGRGDGPRGRGQHHLPQGPRRSRRRPDERRQKLMDDYKARFANPYSAAERGYIDDVIEPQQTRPKLIRALRTLQTKRVAQPQRKHGNIPL